MAINNGYESNAFLVISLVIITGIGGGIYRDVLINNVPVVLRKRIYAVASLIGGIVFYEMYTLRVDTTITIFITIIVVFVIRMLSTIFKWNLPSAFK